MGREDEIENAISNLKFKVIDAKTYDESVAAYAEFKDLTLAHQQAYWPLVEESFENFDEGYFYNLLDRVIDISREESTGITSVDLAKFFRVDEGLKRYCEVHIQNDGIMAALKYKAQLNFKKNLIAEALLL